MSSKTIKSKYLLMIKLSVNIRNLFKTNRRFSPSSKNLYENFISKRKRYHQTPTYSTEHIQLLFCTNLTQVVQINYITKPMFDDQLTLYDSSKTYLTCFVNTTNDTTLLLSHQKFRSSSSKKLPGARMTFFCPWIIAVALILLKIPERYTTSIKLK